MPALLKRPSACNGPPLKRRRAVESDENPQADDGINDQDFNAPYEERLTNFRKAVDHLEKPADIVPDLYAYFTKDEQQTLCSGCKWRQQ